MTVEKRSIPVFKPWMDEREAEAVKRPILKGWVTQGSEVAAFEEEFARYTGARHACAVSSCTTALHLALLAAGTRPGDEVITASHSFIATANAIRYCGATPVFADIEPATFNLDPQRVEEAIGPRTRAILCVHQIGMPCGLERLAEIARRRSLPLVEDAACAAGSEILREGRWEKIGKPYGDIACFSFHPRKLLTTGDGGMLTTSNPDFDRRFRLWRQHGMSVSDAVRHQAKEVVFESYPELGYNYRLTDIQAAMGRVQLERLPEVIARRRSMAEHYAAGLRRIAGLEPPAEPPWARSNWQSYCIYLPEGCDQRRVMQRMLDRGVSTRRGILCIHREKAHLSLGQAPQAAARGLPNSERAQDRCILLPLYHTMTESDQDTVLEALKDALQ